ncbi:F-box protein-like protein [Tanacetum coccineum]
MVIRCNCTPVKEIVLTISNAGINCVSLRVLELGYVSISDKVLHRLLSTCSLLEKITLVCRGLKEFKVRNLLYLRELTIQPHEKNHTLEIYDVPNIRSFTYGTPSQRNHLPFNRCAFGNVTELSLDGAIISDAFSDLIKSNFHCLENLTLKWSRWGPKSLDITCLTLKRLFLLLDRWNRGDNYINVQIYAPKLHIFNYHGLPVPSLKFSAIVPKQIKLVHRVYSYGFDDSFFPKIREALMLTSEFDIKIGLERFDLVDINVDDVRRGVKFPATNVEHLTVETYIDSGLWDHSPFFDTFFTEVIEMKTRKGFWPEYLKEVEIKTGCNGGKWETVTSSWKSFLDGSSLADCYKVEFRLNWFSS